MKKTFTFLFILAVLSCPAQNYKKLKRYDPTIKNKWAWSLDASVFAISDIKTSHVSIGANAEWFLNEHWSLRGGFAMGPDFVKLTTEPFVLWVLADPSDDRTHYHSHNMFRSYGGRSNSGAAMKALALLILDSDALCYNIPLTYRKDWYFSVFASPLQTMFTMSDNKTHAYSLVGAGVKYIGKKGLVFNANVEYDNGAIWKSNSGYGVKTNFAIGFMLR
ncbi:MAG: hypothetical protein ACXVC6_12830 [Bacteroidia bacterium]